MPKKAPEKWTGKLIGKMHVNNVKSADLAEELGVSQAYISMLLNSKRNAAGAKERLEAAYEAILANRKQHE